MLSLRWLITGNEIISFLHFFNSIWGMARWLNTYSLWLSHSRVFEEMPPQPPWMSKLGFELLQCFILLYMLYLSHLKKRGKNLFFCHHEMSHPLKGKATLLCCWIPGRLGWWRIMRMCGSFTTGYLAPHDSTIAWWETVRGFLSYWMRKGSLCNFVHSV